MSGDIQGLYGELMRFVGRRRRRCARIGQRGARRGGRQDLDWSSDDNVAASSSWSATRRRTWITRTAEIPGSVIGEARDAGIIVNTVQAGRIARHRGSSGRTWRGWATANTSPIPQDGGQVQSDEQPVRPRDHRAAIAHRQDGASLWQSRCNRTSCAPSCRRGPPLPLTSRWTTRSSTPRRARRRKS